MTSPNGNALFNALQGRTTTFLAFFTIMGTVMHWFHRLDGVYIGFVTVIMGYVLAKSVQDDLKDVKDKSMAPQPQPQPAVLPPS